MSTSSSPIRQRSGAEVDSFQYAEVPAQRGTAWDPQQERARLEDAAREAGRREGEAHARAILENEIESLRKTILGAVNQFAGERREYFRAVEPQIVSLALAIARKILHRESQLDPLLLAGMVRVALEKIAKTTRVALRVHPHLVSDFRTFFARHMQETPPDVVEDAALAPDVCLIETELGRTEIGPEIQLKEIEQGLLDLQAARPGARVGEQHC